MNKDDDGQGTEASGLDDLEKNPSALQDIFDAEVCLCIDHEL